MDEITRRNFLKSAGGVAGGIGVAKLPGGVGILSARAKKTDVRIEDISYSYEEYLYRAPVKFAGSVMNRATLLTVSARSARRPERSPRGSDRCRSTCELPAK